MKPLAIVAYSDGRTGHEKQTLAVLQALADNTTTTVTFKKVSVSFHTYCKSWITYLVPFLQRPKPEYSNSVDLILGTGSRTHLPMLLEKTAREKLHNKVVRVVTCMSPEPFLQKKFDLCCIPAHDDVPVRDNVFVTLGPPSPNISKKKQQPDRGLILVGGVDTRSHKWDSKSVLDRIQTIIRKNPDMKWTVSSSPRTPEDTCRKLEDLASRLESMSFFKFEQTPAGWVEQQYAANKTVWVTADSISMVYEALNAGCTVGIIPVEWLKQGNKFQKSLGILHDRKMIIEFGDWSRGAKMPAPPTEQFSEAMRCAREILQRWWPERLST